VALRLAIDTNVLVYSEGVERVAGDRAKIGASRELLEAIVAAGDQLLLPVQVLAELQHVLVRKGGLAAATAAGRVRRLAQIGEARRVEASDLDAALDLAADHGLQIFDAMILAAAADAGCELLLSEDFQDGFAWRGLVVTNPFGPAPDGRLARLLGAGHG
jgi:predicted nucleic acid-binding protein